MPEFIENSTLIWLGAIGMFIIYRMLFTYSSNKLVNVYLVVIFVLCSIRNIWLGISDVLENRPMFDPKFVTPIFLSTVPCIFLYFKYLVKDYRVFRKKDLFHFAFPILILTLNLAQELLNLFKNKIIEDVRFASVVAFLALYIVLSYKILNKNLWKQTVEGQMESRHFYLVKDWTQFVFVISTLMFLRIIYSICIEKMFNDPLQGYRFSLVTVLPWLLIYGRILIIPEILYGYPRLKKHPKQENGLFKINDLAWVYDLNSITGFQKERLKFGTKHVVLSYIFDLENYVQKSHPFRKRTFSFQDLADILEIPLSHLDYIFKYYSVMSLEEYKVSCMVNDAKQLMEKRNIDVSELDQLSLQVGFSEYTDFTANFKEFTGTSPEDYLRIQCDNMESKMMDYA